MAWRYLFHFNAIWGTLLAVLNQRAAEFSFSTPSAPPLTYTFKLIRVENNYACAWLA